MDTQRKTKSMTAVVEGEKLIVAAIDFGSAYSGYAFQMRHAFKNNPVDIITNHWNSDKSGFMSEKTPSVVLLDDKQQFHEFGYDAEDKYAELTDTNEHKDWYYFTDIKMKLMNALDTITKEDDDTSSSFFKERITRDAKIKDMEDREYPLLDLMAMIYKYLVEHLLKQLDDKGLLTGVVPSTSIAAERGPNHCSVFGVGSQRST